jgi:hypothetical protein
MQRWQHRGQSGQAVVEAAIILPAMLFMLLLALQLTMLQQARIATEYAAFAAARAGIVMNANNGNTNGTGRSDGPMRDAAVMAILPTFGRADSLTELTKTKLNFEKSELTLRPFGISQVRVAVLSPRRQDFATQTHLNGKEIDFDDIRPTVAEATLLSVQVRYLYELRIPFANKMIQAIWMASKVGMLTLWGGSDLSGPRLGNNQSADAVEISRTVALARGSVPDGTPEGTNLTALTLVSNLPATTTRGEGRRYLLPVSAWYTMRMQSNPFLQWAAP